MKGRAGGESSWKVSLRELEMCGIGMEWYLWRCVVFDRVCEDVCMELDEHSNDESSKLVKEN